MYVCTISTLFIVVVVCMYVQESPVCIFYPMVWYIHMVLTAILPSHCPCLRAGVSEAEGVEGGGACCTAGVLLEAE